MDSYFVVTLMLRTGSKGHPVTFLMEGEYMGDNRLKKLDADIERLLLDGKSAEDCKDEMNPECISHGDYTYTKYHVREITEPEFNIMFCHLPLNSF